MIIKMEPTLTFLMLVFAQQAPSLTWAPAVSLEPLTVLKLPMQKWEISKCQSTADTAIKGSQLEPLRARGVWWWWWRWKRGVVFPMHRHSLRTHHITCVLLTVPSSCPRRFTPSHLVLRHLVCSKWQPLEYRVGVSIRWQQGTQITGTLFIMNSSKTHHPAIHCVDNALRTWREMIWIYTKI